MIRFNWNDVIRYLVAVRLGQELGTNSDLAQAIAGGIEFLLQLLPRLCS